MSSISFYRQERMDGGIRTGIDINGTSVWHHFDSGGDDSDPALAWYVDVRCKGARLPTDPQRAKDWFLSQADVIRTGLRTLADNLRAGIDADSWPLQWQVPDSPRGVRMTIACSATRRLNAITMAAVLKDIAAHWQARLQQLLVVQPVPD